MRKILFACVLGLICLSIGFAAFQKPVWVVPEEARQRKNPIAPSEAVLHSAKQSYLEQCANCHGDAAKGDGSDAMMYDPAPADLTDPVRMGKLTDGEIFYKITEGKKPMPSFRTRLTEEQRWQLVIFVRSLAGVPSAPPPAKQPDAPGDKKPVPPAAH